jgi:hypothetical protein
MKKSIFVFLSILYLSNLEAQENIQKNGTTPIPTEILIGNESLNYQMVINKKFSPTSKLGLFSLVSFAADYKNSKAKNEFMVPVQVNYALNKNFAINMGIAMNSNWGFRPTAGLQYLYLKKELIIFDAPSVYLTETHSIENFGFILFKPEIKKNLSLYSKLQLLYSINTETGMHDRSYDYVRLGLSIKTLSFGIAANWDWYGPMKYHKQNLGIFIAKDFF